MSSDRRHYMYRNDNEFVRRFNSTRKKCEEKGLPVSPEFCKNAKYVTSNHPLSIPLTSAGSAGAVNFYNYCITLCTSAGQEEICVPAMFRLKDPALGLVSDNVIIDQSKALIRTNEFVETALLIYSQHTSFNLIEQFKECYAKAPAPTPLPPDPLTERLLKYKSIFEENQSIS